MRALLRVFGVAVPLGSKRFMNDLHRLLAEKQGRVPERVRRTVLSLWDEVRDLEQRIGDVGNELATVAQQEPVMQALMQIPGFGILTATAVFATVADIHAFRNGRQLACWFGLTPREFSSGSRRRLGRISNKPLTQLQAWTLQRAGEMHGNKAAVAGKQARAHRLGRLVPRA